MEGARWVTVVKSKQGARRGDLTSAEAAGKRGQARAPTLAGNAGADKKKKKNKPMPTQDLGLGGFMERAFANAQKKKNVAQVKTKASIQPAKAKLPKAKPSQKEAKSGKGVALQANPNRLDGSTSMMVRKGKVRASGPKKKRPSTLKKCVFWERRIRFHLAHPEMSPVPLQKHPAMLGYDDETVEEEEEEEEDDDNDVVRQVLNEIVLEILSGDVTDVVDGDECGMSGRDDAVMENGVDVDTTDDETWVHVRENETSDENEQKEQLHSEPFQWDARVISPVFFGRSVTAKHETGEKTTAPEMKIKRLWRSAHSDKQVPSEGAVREYVTQALSTEMDNLVKPMLSRLMELQERVRLKDKVKAQFNRRLVFGFREVKRGVKSRRCKCIIVAPNIEQGSDSFRGGIDDTVKELLDSCRPTQDELDQGKEGVAVVFALNKSKLGAALNKKIPVSCVGIYSADGAHEEFKKVRKLAARLSELWSDTVGSEAYEKKYALCSSCHAFCEYVRYDCIECRKTRCRRCSTSEVARKVPCAGAQRHSLSSLVPRDDDKKKKKRNKKERLDKETTSGIHVDSEPPKPCSIVRISRSVPLLEAEEARERSRIKVEQAAKEAAAAKLQKQQQQQQQKKSKTGPKNQQVGIKSAPLSAQAAEWVPQFTGPPPYLI